MLLLAIQENQVLCDNIPESSKLPLNGNNRLILPPDDVNFKRRQHKLAAGERLYFKWKQGVLSFALNLSSLR